MTSKNVIAELKKFVNAEKAEFFPRFFKTGEGQYGYGDKFLGVTVPNQRIVAKKNKDMPLAEIKRLLKNEFHEARLTALLILGYKYAKADAQTKKEIYDFYLKNTKYINNWDLVDSSASYIVGAYCLETNDFDILYKLAKSESLWEQRIAIVATLHLIRNIRFKETLEISEILLNHKHDLIHKAVGWMLREVGKKDLKPLREFLDKHSKTMPRTMLRYAIERLDGGEKKKYMGK